jgi:hypothetical protein
MLAAPGALSLHRQRLRLIKVKTEKPWLVWRMTERSCGWLQRGMGSLLRSDTMHGLRRLLSSPLQLYDIGEEGVPSRLT